MKKLFIFISVALISCSTKEKPAKTFENQGNIFVVFTNGIKKQLTFNQTDLQPILLPSRKEIVFVRDFKTALRKTKKIMLVNIANLEESVLTDKKSYKDADSKETAILSIENLRLSLDGENLLFVAEKYITSNQLVKVNIKTGNWTELFSAATFEILENEPYKGYFLVGQSTIEDRGRDIYYRLVSDSGKIIKKFRDIESMNTFKSELDKHPQN